MPIKDLISYSSGKDAGKGSRRHRPYTTNDRES
jgi:hypothetical protein